MSERKFLRPVLHGPGIKYQLCENQTVLQRWCIGNSYGVGPNPKCYRPKKLFSLVFEEYIR